MNIKRRLINIPLALIILTLLLLPTAYYKHKVLAEGDIAAAFKISVDPTAHEDYGLAYPATYKFNIPRGSSNLTAWQKKTIGASWEQLTEKTTNDFFSGIDAVRFDYTNNFSYVSVAFGSTSDDIFILFKDTAGDPVSGISFVEIPLYYDNRKAVVVFTGDDWSDANKSAFELAAGVCASKGIWMTGGARTWDINPETWVSIQTILDNGYVEIGSHSRTHPDPPGDPYDDPPGTYDTEIGGSAQDIRDNLDLPSIYKKGTTEYIPAWLEPNHYSDNTVRQKLGEYKYLISRRGNSNNPTFFTTWDETNRLYNRTFFSCSIIADTLEWLNNLFDETYIAGGIYSPFAHPSEIDWSPGQKAQNHFDYIGGKKDVWYVGFGALYMYHYIQERGLVNLGPIVTTLPATEVYMDGGTHATLKGSLDSLGGAPTADIWFEWGYSTSYGNTVGSKTVATTGTYTYNLAGYNPSETVYYRFVGENVDGTTYGSAQTFYVTGSIPNAYRLATILPVVFLGIIILMLVAFIYTGSLTLPVLILMVILILLGVAGLKCDTSCIDGIVGRIRC